jgi:hypothetical protein
MTAPPQPDKHPSEMGADVDALPPNPSPALQGAAPPAADTDSQKPVCYNLATGAPVGYLTSSSNWTALTPDEALGVTLMWCPVGADQVLRADQTPSYRYLGTTYVSGGQWACWGLWGGGFVCPAVYNADRTITLQPFPDLRLCGETPAPGELTWVYLSTPNDPNCLQLVYLM